MYLVDREIRASLPEIDFETGDPQYPFLADDQIQPCSVDLRMDSTFWRPRGGSTIDLRRAKLLELSPRRNWRKIELGHDESIDLRPGEMLLGRTFERFTVPATCAGKLEGRSSFARMGIAVHCSADFINPGYRGRMPLEIVNHGKNTIRLFPLIPICQVMFVRLKEPPDRAYGDRELSSKYMDDDGGPSYWWRDKRIRRLQVVLGEHDVVERVQDEILKLLGSCDPELIERFEALVQRSRPAELTNAHELLDRFAKTEDGAQLRAKLSKGIFVGIAPVLIACSIGSLFSQPFGWLHYVLWALTVLSIPLSVRSLGHEVGGFLTTRDLASLTTRRS